VTVEPRDLGGRAPGPRARWAPAAGPGVGRLSADAEEPRPGGRGSSAGGGRYWVRTSDLFRVREARYRCANRPGRHRRLPFEVGTRVEPVYTALQAVASPLGQPTG